MTFNAAILKTFDKNFKTTMRIGNGELLEVKGKGTVEVRTSTGIKLIDDVLYVSELNQNLLSVGQMLEKGYSLEFKNKNYIIF